VGLRLRRGLRQRSLHLSEAVARWADGARERDRALGREGARDDGVTSGPTRAGWVGEGANVSLNRSREAGAQGGGARNQASVKKAPSRSGHRLSGGGAARLGWAELGAVMEISLEDASVRYEIGRLLTSEICLQHDRGVSRRHAEIVSMAGRWQLTDLGSRNGTYVNGELVRATATLVNGAVIKCGTTELRFGEPMVGDDAQAPSTEGLTAWPPLSEGDRRFLVVFTRPFGRIPESQLAGVRPPKNSEIADELGYSEQTIRKRLKELYRKFDLADLPNDRRRQELALRARIHRGVLSERSGGYP